MRSHRIIKQNHITRVSIALSSVAITALVLSSFATAPAADQTTRNADDKPSAAKSVRLTLPARPGPVM